jgi:hypothetical protein
MLGISNTALDIGVPSVAFLSYPALDVEIPLPELHVGKSQTATRAGWQLVILRSGSGYGDQRSTMEYILASILCYVLDFALPPGKIRPQSTLPLLQHALNRVGIITTASSDGRPR